MDFVKIISWAGEWKWEHEKKTSLHDKASKKIIIIISSNTTCRITKSRSSV